MSKTRLKGFLSFLILWSIHKGCKTGVEIMEEFERRKGYRPSPGTIYPVLKKMKEEDGLLNANEDKQYSLTKEGKKELKLLTKKFVNVFSDIDEMKAFISESS